MGLLREWMLKQAKRMMIMDDKTKKVTRAESKIKV